LRSDRFFDEEHRLRLEYLMARWRAARDVGAVLPPEEQAELEHLVDAELSATTHRAAAKRGESTP